MDNKTKQYLDQQFKNVNEQFNQMDQRFDTIEKIQLRMELRFGEKLAAIWDKVSQFDDHIHNHTIHLQPKT